MTCSPPKKVLLPPPLLRKGHTATCGTDPYYGLVTILSQEIKHISVCHNTAQNSPWHKQILRFLPSLLLQFQNSPLAGHIRSVSLTWHCGSVWFFVIVCLLLWYEARISVFSELWFGHMLAVAVNSVSMTRFQFIVLLRLWYSVSLLLLL